MLLRALLLLALLVTPALAQGWDTYRNDRFGYDLAVPPGFQALGESDNSDGQSFVDTQALVELRVWGASLTYPYFEAETIAAIDAVEASGWDIMWRVTTPGWANFSARKGSQVLYERMVLLCDRQNSASLRVEYPVARTQVVAPLLEQLAESLKSGC